MSVAKHPGRMVEGFGSDRFRVRLATKAGGAAVKVELLQPLASHTPDTLMVVGRPLIIPLGQVSALIEAMDHAKREALEGGAHA